MAARAMPSPPEADPVMPASEVTVTASCTSGLGMECSASATMRNPGSAAITAPKPYSDAVFMPASRAPLTARSEEHTSELQSRGHLVCRLLRAKKKPASYAWAVKLLGRGSKRSHLAIPRIDEQGHHEAIRRDMDSSMQVLLLTRLAGSVGKCST